MADQLEELVRQTKNDIEKQNTDIGRVKNKRAWRPPKVSVAIVIWLIALLIGITEFSDGVSFVFKPAEAKIERDLTSILRAAAGSLRKYEIENGILPPLLPNPAIRGLVDYERSSDFGFKLEATVGNVTMVLDSAATTPHRAVKQK